MAKKEKVTLTKGEDLQVLDDELDLALENLEHVNDRVAVVLETIDMPIDTIPSGLAPKAEESETGEESEMGEDTPNGETESDSTEAE